MDHAGTNPPTRGTHIYIVPSRNPPSDKEVADPAAKHKETTSHRPLFFVRGRLYSYISGLRRCKIRRYLRTNRIGVGGILVACVRRGYLVRPLVMETLKPRDYHSRKFCPGAPFLSRNRQTHTKKWAEVARMAISLLGNCSNKGTILCPRRNAHMRPISHQLQSLRSEHRSVLRRRSVFVQNKSTLEKKRLNKKLSE